MSNRDTVHWVIPQSVLLVWVLISPLDSAPVQEIQDRKMEKAAEKLVDWDYAGLHLVDHVPLQDKLNYHELCMLRRERQFRDVPNRVAKHSNHAKRRKRRAVRRAKIVYPTQKVVDYLNEREYKEHDEKMGVRNRKGFEQDLNDIKAKAYYTSNESKKKPIYQINERAIQEKEVEKAIDYQNYNADLDYQLKCKAYYFKDDAKYKNKPKTLSEKMGHKEGPKYKFKRMRRHAKETPEYTTWAVVHYSGPHSKHTRPNYTIELDKMIKDGLANMKCRQEALEAPGHWPEGHLLEENRTTYRLSTYRNFVEEAKTFEPYTFPPNDMDRQLNHIDSNIWLPSEEYTTPRGSYNDWINAQLKEYRKKYQGLTVQDPFAHYPEYTWENLGFDLKKVDDPFPPIWPEKHMRFNADVLKEHFAASVPPEEPYDPKEWDSQGREMKTVYRPPTRKVIIPNI